MSEQPPAAPPAGGNPQAEPERAGLFVTVAPGGIARLFFNYPGEKINKLDTPVMEALASTLARLKVRGERGELHAMVIGSSKPGVFIAGADLSEIEGITDPAEGMSKAWRGQQILDMLEALPFPTVCAVNGACVGGGYELALACTRIVASDDSRVQIGLPEVRLGIIPGFGGTQRLPRRAGLRGALDIILAGKTVDARRALRARLVDAVVPAELLDDEAMREARRLSGRPTPEERSSATGPRGEARPAPFTARLIARLLDGNPLGRAIVASQARKTLAARAPEAHYPAPYRALESVLGGYRRSRAKAYENEARLLGEMIVTRVSKNLVFLFNAHNAAKKDRGVSDPAVRPAEVRKVGVLGAGVMGAGIAQVATGADLPVRLKDLDRDLLARGLASIASGYRSRLKRKRIDRREFERKVGLVTTTTDWSGFRTCDLVIEAIVERLDVKQRVLDEAEEVLGDEAIFATNTSSLLVTEIAARARRPGRVVGLHFFNPAPRMPLVEVVAGRLTDEAVVATATAFVARVGKVPVVVRDGPGFLVNRLLMPYLGEAIALAEKGSDPEAIDRDCVAWGWPMGPFRLLDEIGLDVARHAAAQLSAAFPGRVAKSTGTLDRMVEAGRLGSKSGLGFYRHGGEGKGRGKGSKEEPAFDAEARAIIGGSGGASVTGERLMDMLVLPIVNEAAQCLAEAVVRSARDVDLAMVMGTGFPPFRGGPLRYADELGGPAEVARRLGELASRFGKHLEPVPHLAEMSGRFHD